MPLFTCGPHVILNVFFSLETIPVGIINHMVTLILSHYYHWRHGDIKMWSRNRTVSHSHTKNERKKGEKKRKGRARGSMSERENRQEERRKIWRSKVFCLFLNDNGFWEKTLTNFKISSTVCVMFSYLVTVGCVK